MLHKNCECATSATSTIMHGALSLKGTSLNLSCTRFLDYFMDRKLNFLLKKWYPKLIYFILLYCRIEIFLFRSFTRTFSLSFYIQTKDQSKGQGSIILISLLFFLDNNGRNHIMPFQSRQVEKTRFPHNHPTLCE